MARRIYTRTQPGVQFRGPKIPVPSDAIPGHLSLSRVALQSLDMNVAQQLGSRLGVQQRLEFSAVTVIQFLIHGPPRTSARRTRDTGMFKVVAITRSDLPCERRLLTASRSTWARGRPMCFPIARAWARPARTRSAIRSLSN